MSDSPRVAAVQFEPVVGDVAANADAVAEAVATLPASVEVAVFPELCTTGYDLDVALERAEPVPGSLTDRYVDIAARHDTDLVVGVPERDGDDVYNSLALVDDSGVRATYRKQYPWGDEADVFATGDGPTTVDTAVGTVGFALCYDLNFPEVGLAYAETGCDVLLVSAAWRASYDSDWRLLSRARALDGPFYVAGSNHVGDQRGREHGGGSLVVDPAGRVRSTATDGSGHAVASVTEDRLRECRERNPVRETRGWTDAT